MAWRDLFSGYYQISPSLARAFRHTPRLLRTVLLRSAFAGGLEDFSVEWVGRVYGHSLLVRSGDFIEVIGCFFCIYWDV